MALNPSNSSNLERLALKGLKTAEPHSTSLLVSMQQVEYKPVSRESTLQLRCQSMAVYHALSKPCDILLLFLSRAASFPRQIAAWWPAELLAEWQSSRTPWLSPTAWIHHLIHTKHIYLLIFYFTYLLIYLLSCLLIYLFTYLRIYSLLFDMAAQYMYRIWYV